MLDSDLASIYGVTTARLNQQVRRNAERFPTDFMFEISSEEFDGLMMQIATSNTGGGGRRKLPLAFTEYDALMAANVLKSSQAVNASVQALGNVKEPRNKTLSRKLAPGERYRSRQVANGL
jgi:hypothetical protein